MRLLACAAAVVAAGCGVPGLAPDRFSQAIVGGQATSADDSVFALQVTFDGTQNVVCSAVLIAPRTLLTAAHCVDPAKHGATSVSSKATHLADANQAQAADFVAVSEQRLHPLWDAAAAQSPHDLAALLLATAQSPTPAQWNRAALDAQVGRPLRLVGYGRTSPGTADTGQRRVVTVPLSSLDADTLSFGTAGAAGICAGDSGGPSFLTFGDGVERAVGVHSVQTSSSCGDGSDVRLDAHAAFVDQWLADKEAPQCGPDGQCRQGCAPVDLDCLPVAQLGDACDTSVRCAAGSVCAGPNLTGTTCRPECQDDTCPTGATCGAGANGARYCRADSPAIPPGSGSDGAVGRTGCGAAPGAVGALALVGLVGARRRRLVSQSAEPAGGLC